TFRARLVAPDSVTPVVGAVVELTAVSDAAARVRALSGSRGQVALRVPEAGRYRARVLRIGFQPVALGDFDLSGDPTAELLLVFSAQAVSLAAVRVERDSECRDRSGAGGLAASLLEQARVALASTLLTSSDGSAVATWENFSIITDRLGTPLTPQLVLRQQSATAVPFRSAGVEALIGDGFARLIDDAFVFYAPDAEVLLDERFIARQCFQETTHPSDSALVGLHFEPSASARRTPAIDGTLWMDRRSAELRYLDFQFNGIDPDLRAAGAGGHIGFRRLESGIWMVDRWTLRLPRPTSQKLEAVLSPVGQQTTRRSVNVVEHRGGVVIEVRRGAESLYRSESDAASALPEVAARVGRTPVCEGAANEREGNSGIVFGQVIDSSGVPVSRATVRASWVATSGSRFSRSALRDSREYPAHDGFFIFCGLPIGGAVQVSVLDGSRAAVTSSVRLVPSAMAASVNIVWAKSAVDAAAASRKDATMRADSARAACAAALPDSLGMLYGGVSDVRGEPRAAATVIASWWIGRFENGVFKPGTTEQSARTDVDGSFTLCGVPREQMLSLRAERADETSGTIEIALDGASQQVALSVADPAPRRDLSGRLVDDTGAAIAAAMIVWRGDSSVVARTDATGRFVLANAPAGTGELMVRTVGFAPMSVAVSGSQADSDLGAITLVRPRVTLTEVRIEETMLTRERAGFEERRRGASAGVFITDEMLRGLPPISASMMASFAPRLRAVGRTLRLRAGGFGFCRPRFFEDGIDVGRLDLKEQEADQISLLERAKRVEVYTAASAPPRFNDNDGCGAIVVWTR
ncbi:MAG: carboxypeptidase regulatory-like domain-containing protein, partial [Gemmatimonadaceae bacterium]|nr:carboxypeptidase regulatory-like domain-containing protein [Gemmatimonadaceae bacterium]